MKVVAINSQGQVTIPAVLRRKLGFDQTDKAVVKEEKGRVVVEPMPDIDSLAGSLHQYAKPDQTPQALMLAEKKAIEEVRREKFKKKEQGYSQDLLEI